MSCCPMFKWSLLALVVVVLIGAGFVGQTIGADEKLPGYTDTPMIPGQKWHGARGTQKNSRVGLVSRWLAV